MVKNSHADLKSRLKKIEEQTEERKRMALSKEIDSATVITIEKENTLKFDFEARLMKYNVDPVWLRNA